MHQQLFSHNTYLCDETREIRLDGLLSQSALYRLNTSRLSFSLYLSRTLVGLSNYASGRLRKIRFAETNARRRPATPRPTMRGPVWTSIRAGGKFIWEKKSTRRGGHSIGPLRPPPNAINLMRSLCYLAGFLPRLAGGIFIRIAVGRRQSLVGSF